MCNFDQWLRDALIDANLLLFENVLADADTREFDFSPQYLRERTRILADPFGWSKRRSRSGGSRAARSIACAVLVCALALGTLMAASPASEKEPSMIPATASLEAMSLMALCCMVCW